MVRAVPRPATRAGDSDELPEALPTLDSKIAAVARREPIASL
jgi:hypothetical protein